MIHDTIQRLYYSTLDLLLIFDCSHQDLHKYLKVSGVKVINCRIKKIKAKDLAVVREAMVLMNKPKTELLKDLYHEKSKEDIVSELLKLRYK